MVTTTGRYSCIKWGQPYGTHRSTCPVQSALTRLLTSVGDQMHVSAHACWPGPFATWLECSRVTPGRIPVHRLLAAHSEAARRNSTAQCQLCPLRRSCCHSIMHMQPSCITTSNKMSGAAAAVYLADDCLVVPARRRPVCGAVAHAVSSLWLKLSVHWARQGQCLQGSKVPCYWAYATALCRLRRFLITL